MTKTISEFIGAQTVINKDSNGLIQMIMSVIVDESLSVSVSAKADATAQHTVTNNGKVSRAVSKLAGANTTVDVTGNVTTVAGSEDDGEGYDIKAVVFTDINGESVTRFIKVSQTDANDVSLVETTLKDSSAFALGNEVEISKINNVLYIKVITPLDKPIVID